MKTKTPKSVLMLSILLASLFVLAQFILRTTGSMGPWCFPSLEATQAQGHPAYEFFAYGFPLPFLNVLSGNCFEAGSIIYEWLPIGLIVDSLLLVLIAYPTWARFLRKRSKKQE